MNDPFHRSENPGADPTGLMRTSAPAGMSACFICATVGVRPQADSRADILSSASDRRRSGRRVTAATASRVRSSDVGPKPPVTIITSARVAATRSVSAISSSSSPTTDLHRTSTPRDPSRADKKREFVSRRPPMSNSEPIAMISPRFIARMLASDIRRVNS